MTYFLRYNCAIMSRQLSAIGAKARGKRTDDSRYSVFKEQYSFRTEHPRYGGWHPAWRIPDI
jgi:hypothetical protein